MKLITGYVGSVSAENVALRLVPQTDSQVDS